MIRRQFIGEASCSAVGSVGVLGSILNLKLIGQLAAQSEELDDYRAIVCLFLGGGNDSFNMLTPGSGAGYSEYLETRGELALPLGQLSPLGYELSDGRELSLNSAMPRINTLFQSGEAAFLANVGTMVQPVTKDSYEDSSAKLPAGLFSHSDQQQHWQTALPDSRQALTGFAGRLADAIKDLNSVEGSSMNISLGGQSLFQTGDTVLPFITTPAGAPRLDFDNLLSYESRRQTRRGLLEEYYENAYARAFSRLKTQAIDDGEAYRVVIETTPDFTNDFTANNPLSVKFRQIARTIAGRDQLANKRQTFFVDLSGFDLHGRLNGSHEALLATVDQALGEFYKVLGDLAVQEQVVTFTASDFARTLTSNGGGSDHAWGANHLVIGGGVKGGMVHGKYPSLAVDSELDIGRGRLIPTTSVDEYFAELALWMGAQRSDLPVILPNLSRFHATGSTEAPIGFLLD